MIERPTLHPPIPMQTRVKFIKTGSPTLEGRVGTVKGVSSSGIAFSYSVLLDQPIFSPAIGEDVEIVSIVGSCLETL